MLHWFKSLQVAAPANKDTEHLYTQLREYEERLTRIEAAQQRAEKLAEKAKEVFRKIDAIYSAIPVAERVFTSFQEAAELVGEYRAIEAEQHAEPTLQ